MDASENGSPRPFASHDALLDGARTMCRERRARVAAEAPGAQDRARMRTARARDREATRAWHDSVRATGSALPFAGACTRTRLGRIERELLIILVLERLAVLGVRFPTAADVVDFLGYSARDALAAMRALSEDGRLHRAGLIEYAGDDDEDLRDRTVRPDAAIVESFLRSRPDGAAAWRVSGEPALFDELARMTGALRAVAEAHDDERRGCGTPRLSRRARRRAHRLLREIEHTLQAHPGWRLGALFSAEVGLDHPARLILLALIGKECGHLPHDESLFTGGGLARAASPDPSLVRGRLRLLRSDGRLQSAGLVQPTGGSEALLTDDERTLEDLEFELGPAGIELFGLDRRPTRRGAGRFAARPPVARLDQLVLPERVADSVRMALAHARHASTLLDAWGLSEVLPYGRTVAMLLSGPPGVGKTACAEAIAAELGRAILVVDYSQLQNCYHGQTEKNIVRVFREARRSEAVLFWDEADAVFFDRSRTQFAWEAREINVLLQELERFDGVCILATNRKIVLDPALSRRIAIKIELDRPDRELRRHIWSKLLPAKLPLGRDVDVERLAGAELVGGEIKNVIVNAARLALVRGGESEVTMADFEHALRQEHENRWGTDATRRLGFGARAE